jgi:hypothetical protein
MYLLDCFAAASRRRICNSSSAGSGGSSVVLFSLMHTTNALEAVLEQLVPCVGVLCANHQQQQWHPEHTSNSCVVDTLPVATAASSQQLNGAAEWRGMLLEPNPAVSYDAQAVGAAAACTGP